jgi:coenzyme F420-reducing hydrogenase delta subunit
MYNLSAGEGSKFAAFANEFVDQIREIGPSPINLVRAGKAPVVTEKEAT